MQFNNGDNMAAYGRPNNIDMQGMSQQRETFMGRDSPQITQVVNSQPAVREAIGTDPPVKEIRTFMRDGTTITEEYERLNPDGTVTKTVSIGDKQDGLKHFGVYKMDKSGIVRRIDNPDQGEPDIHSWENEMRQMVANQRDNLLKKSHENMIAQTNKYKQDYGVPENQNSFHDKANELKQKMQELTPSQRAAIFNKYKQSLTEYGTKKLENILRKKLNDHKLTEKFPLTDDQKDQLMSYGVKKLHKLLHSSLDEDKFFTQVFPFDDGNQNTYEHDKIAENSTSSPTTFVFQPNSEATANRENSETLQQNSQNSNKSRPVSFVIRPAYETNKFSVTDSSQNQTNAIFNRNKTVLKQQLNMDKTNEGTSVSNKVDPDNLPDYDEDSLVDIYNTLLKELKENHAYEKSSEKTRKKQELLVNTLEGIEKLLDQFNVDDESNKDTSVRHGKEEKQELNRTKHVEKDVRPKLKEAKRKEKYDDDLDDADVSRKEKRRGKYDEVIDLFDEDEIFEYGLRSLRKLIRKQNLKEQCEDELSHKDKKKLKSQTKQSLEDESSPKFRLGYDSEEEPLESDWDEKWYEKAPSQEQKAKAQKPTPKSLPDQQNEKESSNFDAFLSWLGNKLSGDSSANKTLSTPQSETTLNNKKNVYHISQTDSKPNSEPQQNERKLFDFDSLISKIEQTLTQPKNTNSMQQNEKNDIKNSSNYYSQPQPNVGRYELSSRNPQQLINKDHLITRIRRTMENPNTSSSSTQQKSNTYSHQAQTQVDPKTTNRSFGMQQNKQGNGPISFNIHPLGNGKTIEFSNSSPGNQRTFTSTSNKSDEGVFPWWFEQTSQPEFFTKPVIKDTFMKPSFITGSTFHQPRISTQNFSNPLLE